MGWVYKMYLLCHLECCALSWFFYSSLQFQEWNGVAGEGGRLLARNLTQSTIRIKWLFRSTFRVFSSDSFLVGSSFVIPLLLPSCTKLKLELTFVAALVIRQKWDLQRSCCGTCDQELVKVASNFAMLICETPFLAANQRCVHRLSTFSTVQFLALR